MRCWRLIYGLTWSTRFMWKQEPLPISIARFGGGAGIRMNLHEVLRAGPVRGFVYTALSITGADAAGLGLGYLIHVQKKPSFLISAGTAICGGSRLPP